MKMLPIIEKMLPCFTNSCIDHIDYSFILDLRINFDSFFPFASYLTGYVVNSITDCFTLYRCYKIENKIGDRNSVTV